jgi:FkbM family methyltransferase
MKSKLTNSGILSVLFKIVIQEFWLRGVPFHLKIRSYLSLPSKLKSIFQKDKYTKWLGFKILHDNSRSVLLFSSHLVLLAAVRRHIRMNKKFHVLDVGSHYGQFIFAFHLFYPKAEFFAIEPNPQSFKLLEKNLKVNRIKSTIIKAAIDDYSHKKLLYFRLNSLGQSSFYSKKALDSSFKITSQKLVNITVQTTNYHKLKKDIQNDIYVIKIDVEGHEKIVLKQMIKFSPKFLIIELTPSLSGLTLNNVENFLAQLDYNGKVVWNNYKKTTNESYDVLIEKIDD